jgi:hypothetical protein
MMNQYDDMMKTRQWFKDNIVQANEKDIIVSKEMCCGEPMMQYVGTAFVDWTHKCSICKGMYGSA